MEANKCNWRRYSAACGLILLICTSRSHLRYSKTHSLGPSTCCISWNFPQRSVKPCQFAAKGIYFELQWAPKRALCSAHTPTSGLTGDSAPRCGSTCGLDQCYYFKIDLSFKKYFEINIQNFFSVNANQKWNQRCRFEPPVWTDLETTLIGSPRKWLLRHFTTLFIVLRQKPCFAETWGCLLSLTALCRQKTDVTPQARLYPLEIGVCASEEQMGKPKKKSECVTKCFKTSVIAF